MLWNNYWKIVEEGVVIVEEDEIRLIFFIYI